MNREFGFSVQIPFYAAACDPRGGGQETGIAFFLDDGIANCPGGMDERPFIAINFHYNAADYPSPAKHLEVICQHAEVVPTDPGIFGAEVRRWPVMCRQTQANGLIMFILAGEDKKRPGVELSPVARTASFQSPERDLEVHLRTFVAMLKSMRTFVRHSD